MTEGTGPEGPQPPQPLIDRFETTTHLEEGQNLFAQHPFGARIARASEVSRIPEQTLRYGLSLAAAEIPDVDAVFEDEAMKAHRQRIYTTMYRRVRMDREHAIENQLRESEDFRDMERQELAVRFARTMSGLVTSLERSPLWAQYILNKSQGYDLHGDYAREPTPVPEKTYAVWLMEQQQAMTGRRLWGIQEVQPDQYTGTEPIDQARATGAREGARYFMTVKHIQRQ